jgi:hypothetical protein
MDFWYDLNHRKRHNTLQTPLCGVRVTVGDLLQDDGRNKGITLW